jgi:hypothetical protein
VQHKWVGVGARTPAAGLSPPAMGCKPGRKLLPRLESTAGFRVTQGRARSCRAGKGAGGVIQLRGVGSGRRRYQEAVGSFRGLPGPCGPRRRARRAI